MTLPQRQNELTIGYHTDFDNAQISKIYYELNDPEMAQIRKLTV